MTIKDIEEHALKLEPKARARLAEKLLESLERLTAEENARVWAEEAARRRDVDWDAKGDQGRAARDLLREARAKLK